jgi:hypothetical protein
VRARQGKDAEAETLLREAVGILEQTEYRRGLREALEVLAIHLRDRGREAEAELFEERLEGLAPAPVELR